MNQYNDKDQRHGYWANYYLNGQFWFKGNYVNGIPQGFWGFYESNGEIMSKEFYL
jgi:antitoxin component YwqK of YwqJK toxin-antitoxin module